MEALQPLCNDSFSYRWLMNGEDTEGGAFIEIDPRLASLRRAIDAAHDFDFDLLDGLILPLHMSTPARRQQADGSRSSDSDDSILSRSLSLDSSSLLLSLSKRHHRSPYSSAGASQPASPHSSTSPLRFDPSAKRAFSRKQPTASKKILQKYLCFLLPLYKKVKGLKLSWRPGGSSMVVPSTPRSCASSFMGSPRAGDDCCRLTRAALDSGMEKSIHDAVLHCKKSIGESRLVNFS
ncbi:unnamed protein product [Spirodela intermedia]|uniref:Uncharacterized protein n=1 Tax=Spirodela intermedia TaxID=51605 RepID=A0A7I8J6S6_SPIIN|nr:unnamed protein product [Spirodela intermedia]CAA6665936.1 unnamed protein product [Spirodela intermedia]